MKNDVQSSASAGVDGGGSPRRAEPPEPPQPRSGCHPCCPAMASSVARTTAPLMTKAWEKPKKEWCHPVMELKPEHKPAT